MEQSYSEYDLNWVNIRMLLCTDSWIVVVSRPQGEKKIPSMFLLHPIANLILNTSKNSWINTSVSNDTNQVSFPFSQ